MNPELIFCLRIALLSLLLLGLEWLFAKRARRKRARLPRFPRRKREPLPEKWQRALERTYGGRHG